jgi:hypothetical protein
MVQLLAESYNPHVRYGATLALGIACAGTGLAVRAPQTHATALHTYIHNTYTLIHTYSYTHTRARIQTV